MWMWLARISCSLGLLGFLMHNQRQGKMAMASVAGSDKSDKSIDTPEQPSKTNETSKTASVVMKEPKQNGLKLWQIAGLVLGAIIIGNWFINGLIFKYLSAHTADVVLGHHEAQEVANGLIKAEKSLRYDNAMGFIMPALSEAEITAKLRDVGSRLEQHHKTGMLQAAANTIADTIVGFLVFIGVMTNKQKVRDYFARVGNSFLGVPNTAQAFTLLLVSDILVGYHSSDGWQTVLKVIGGHYGFDEHVLESYIAIFVATVPVSMDVAFKFWVFKELRKLSPSTQVILAEIDRH
eukprot:CAMPEP_0174337728 /NCGR_PEP_ID=MMETSP0810-20121108/22557_1 /TAXON_ID=73025 ORGANISM="Eutreptiella gymnastica-like, Strain CCMP1594" /NCGR_SAMPLE_ID=MMETSP0810 /ASSEMBLY_ACC=CAM_ASM_000659 /LENGTH=292 /DNA_ID=CAMNT_0015457365 /DNA_START=276 /DNA_END=1154 /DNA_ORIENTATION=+